MADVPNTISATCQPVLSHRSLISYTNHLWYYLLNDFISIQQIILVGRKCYNIHLWNLDAKAQLYKDACLCGIVVYGAHALMPK